MDFILLRPDLLTRDILDILDILTETKKLPLEEAREIVRQQILKNHYTWIGYIDGQAVCMGSFIVINKLGNNGGRSVFIEDIVVRKDCQNKGYGLILMEFLCRKAESYNPYKLILNCKYELELFYGKSGFKCKGLYMRKDC